MELAERQMKLQKDLQAFESSNIEWMKGTAGRTAEQGEDYSSFVAEMHPAVRAGKGAARLHELEKELVASKSKRKNGLY